MPLSPEDVQALVAAFDGADWDEMTVTIDGTRLALSRTGRPPTHADAPPGGAAAPAASGAAPPAPTGWRAGCSAARGGGSGSTTHLRRRRPGAGRVGCGSARGGWGRVCRWCAPASEPPGGHRVTAPSVGLFWRSPKPGAPPFVEVGDEVGPDDTVCIVEVMKLMNHVARGHGGHRARGAPGERRRWSSTAIRCSPSGPDVGGLRRVLVANRGEIAVRIVRACADAGIESVVAVSEADRASRAALVADRAVCIGPAAGDRELPGRRRGWSPPRWPPGATPCTPATASSPSGPSWPGLRRARAGRSSGRPPT